MDVHESLALYLKMSSICNQRSGSAGRGISFTATETNEKLERFWMKDIACFGNSLWRDGKRHSLRSRHADASARRAAPVKAAAGAPEGLP
jgi:hypothetical protein